MKGVAFIAVCGLGALCGAGVAVARGGPGGFFTALANLLPQVLGGQATTSILANFAPKLAKRYSTSATFVNHDLASCLGEAIEHSLRELARDETRVRRPEERKTIQDLATKALAIWLKLVKHPGTAHWKEDEVKAVLDQHMDACAKAGPKGALGSPMDANSWRLLIEHMLRKLGRELSEKTVLVTAKHLEARSGFYFFELLKQDAEQGGRRFAAGLFDRLGDLRSELPAEVASAVTKAVADLVEGMDERARFRHRRIFLRLVDMDANLRGRLDAVLAALTPEIPLDERESAAASSMSLIRTLRAQQRAIPLIGREQEFAELQAWLDADRGPVAVRLVTGSAGTGKTRLAQELCDLAREREEGWHAGFIARADLDSFLGDLTRNWVWEQPTLIAIDYAAARTDQVERLFSLVERQARQRPGAPPLRIVLLERHRGTDTGSLATLLQSLGLAGHQARNDWYSRREDLALSGFQDRPEVVREILVESGAGEDVDRLVGMLPALRLGESTPLLLHLAVRFRAGIIDAEIEGLLDLLGEWWMEESKIIERQAKADQLPLSTLRAMVVVACLRGGLPDDPVAIWRLAKRELDDWALGAVEDGEKLHSSLAGLLGRMETGGTSSLAPLEPDLMAEFAVLTCFSERAKPDGGPERVRAWLSAHAKERPEQVGTFLVRLCQDMYDDSTWPTLLLSGDWWNALPPAACRAAGSSLPEESVALRELAMSIARACLSAVSGRREEERAWFLNNLGIRFSALGRLEEAHGATQEAVGLYRPLAQAWPDAFEPNLAMSLNNLGAWLSELGRREEALAVMQEAVGLYHRLAQARPDAFEPDLAMSLNGLGGGLSALGRLEEALAATQEALSIYRRLAQARPDAFELGLARSLSNLGNRLSALGHHEGAHGATQEAVGLYRHLAQTRPDAFEPELARSLDNLGVHLSALGRHEDVHGATQEAVGLSRRLARTRPDAFEPDLARSLNNLGIRLAALGRREEAFAATQEAEGLYRRLAQARPDAFEPDLARSLNNLGVQLSELGRHEEALEAMQEAVGLQRRLAQSRPDAFEPDLASSLNNLGSRLLVLGLHEEAREATQEAVGLQRRLAQARPDAFEPDLASSLNNLGVQLSELGRHEEALAATQEAAGIYRRLAQTRPDAFEPNLARSLDNLGKRLSALGCREEALGATKEAVAIRRRLAQSRPDAFEPDLARSLNNLGNRLSELGRRGEAHEATHEAVEIRRRLAEANPGAFMALLATSLTSLGSQLLELGRNEDAHRATVEAVNIYRREASAAPDAVGPRLAIALDLLAQSLTALGRPEEALQARAEAEMIRGHQ